MVSEQDQNTTALDQFEVNSHDIEMYLDVVFNNHDDPIFVKDNECRLLLVNDAFCQAFNLTRNEIIGKTLAETVPPSERDHFLAIDRLVLDKGEAILSEETLTINGSETRVILTRKNRFIDSKGDYFIVGVINDITKRKLAEEELKLAASVFTHAGEGIMITDAKGTIINVNNTFVTSIGYSAVEVIGQKPNFLQSGIHPAEFYSEILQVLQTKGAWSGEIWNSRKNGEIYAEMLNISSVKDVNGQISTMLRYLPTSLQ
jgi:PAS domain S-box-containing protein